VADAMRAWQQGFSQAAPDVTVNYDPIGSGGGREQFLSGGTDFAGSDAYLDDEELTQAQERCAGDQGAVNLPNYIAPIAIPFNVEGVDALNLSADVIARIFGQQITTWDDPAIAELNPEAQLPSIPIVPVNRSDESGTTENFTEYLAQAAPESWTEEPDGVWPVAGGEQGQGTSGVIQAVQAGNGTIGYADASQVGDLPTVAVGVGSEFVEYSPEAAAAVVESGTPVEGRGEFDRAIELNRDTQESGNYPIVLISYHVACLQYEDQETADLVKAFLSYAVSEEGQQAAAEAAGSAPISETLRTQVQESIDQISAAA
jgi:phosphate transport system substrate-binding protein